MKLKARLKNLLLIDVLFAFTDFIIKSKLPYRQLQLQSAQFQTFPAQPRQSLLLLAKCQLGTKVVWREKENTANTRYSPQKKFQHATSLIRSITYH